MIRPAGANTSTERLHIETLDSGTEVAASGAFAEDVRAGLSASPKRLFPKYFYDPLGSQLFDAICLLPEYYLTRAEDEILTRRADEIVAAAAGGETVTLMEFGSGSAVKTRRIIEALLRRQTRLTYVPIDISASALEASARALLQAYPSLGVTPYASDYQTALARLPREALDVPPRGRLLALFLGSNIGNFDRTEAEEFLRSLRSALLRAGDALLLGADLKKERATLEDAYDDPLGVTAAFNLNILARINREFEADFSLRDFRHVAFYNAEAGRVELYIESTRAQSVRIAKLDMTVSFAAGERIHTENSYKYDLAQLSRLAGATGFTLSQTWLDEAERFSSNLFIAAGETGEAR